jgi:beta-glucosidase
MKKVFKFPEGFCWGAATASFQVEGGIENNDWAEAARNDRVPVAGIAVDHYNRYEEDFDLAKMLGHNSHRISIEWSRIEPEEGIFNEKEIEHYKKVLKALRERDIKPFVTIWHFTLPLWFYKKGGFENPESPKIFARYAKKIYSELSDYCVNWATMNEPMVYAWGGYLTKEWPPFRIAPTTFLKVVNNLIKSHNLAYKEIKSLGLPCNVDFVKNNVYYTSNKKPWNLLIKYFSIYFWNHRFIRKTLKNLDSISLNYYFHHQFGRRKEFDTSDMGWDLDPEGIYHVLKELKRYNKKIYITEAGIADEKDVLRANYIRRLIFWIYKALQEGVDVRGYMYWSLLDNYEWKHGFSGRFGLIYIDPETLKRRVRNSAYLYKKICEENALIIE